VFIVNIAVAVCCECAAVQCSLLQCVAVLVTSVESTGFRVWCFWCRVQCLGYRVQSERSCGVFYLST